MSAAKQRTADQAPPVVVEDLMLMSQMPLILFCDWWSTALQSFCHDCGPARPPGSEKDEGQLVVPDPIEEEGEHALFA